MTFRANISMWNALLAVQRGRVAEMHKAAKHTSDIQGDAPTKQLIGNIKNMLFLAVIRVIASKLGTAWHVPSTLGLIQPTGPKVDQLVTVPASTPHRHPNPAN
jgi:hypothetical protein